MSDTENKSSFDQNQSSQKKTSESLTISSENQSQESAKTEKFSKSIHDFVFYSESMPQCVNQISKICKDYGFQRRRFYDVINVLEAVGCCVKTGMDTIFWAGLSNIPRALIKMQNSIQLKNGNFPLAHFFPNENRVSIGRLAYYFILIFLALQEKVLDVKEIAAYFSRENNRYRTTLCKLYQISHILEATSIIERTNEPGKIILSSKYNFPVPIEEVKHHPMSVIALLNNPPDSAASILNQRRKDYQEAVILSMKQNQDIGNQNDSQTS